MSITMNHLTEGEVIRVADDQLETDESQRVNEHLESCAECRAQVSRANIRRQRLSSLLGASDFATPMMSVPQAGTNVIDFNHAREQRTRRSAWAMQPRMRAAAAIILLLLGTLAIEPVRAAVTGWLRSQWNRIAPREQVSPPQQAPSQQAPLPLGPRIEFEHEGRELRLEFISPAVGSVLQLRRGAGTNVVAESSHPGADLLVLPEGLRITGGGAGKGIYAVTVPASITTVTVSSSGRVVARATNDQMVAGMTLQLR